MDENKLKEIVMKNIFTLAGNKRMVKVIANIQYNAKVDNDTNTARAWYFAMEAYHPNTCQGCRYFNKG